jgi:hypothetical protein
MKYVLPEILGADDGIAHRVRGGLTIARERSATSERLALPKYTSGRMRRGE